MAIRKFEDNYNSGDYYGSYDEERFYSERIRRRNRKKARKKRLVTVFVSLAVIAVTYFAAKDSIRKAVETVLNSRAGLYSESVSDAGSGNVIGFSDVPEPAPYDGPVAEEALVSTPDAVRARRFYAGQLDSEEYRIYQDIEQAVRNADSTVTFRSSSVDRVLDIASYIYYDYPEYFWFEGSSSARYHLLFNEYSGTLTLKYNCSPGDIPARKQQIENALKDIVTSLRNSSDYKKVRGAYEYIISHCRYDDGFMDQSCYSVLALGRGVCAGYSCALNLILHELGIESIYVKGLSEGEPHAWNMVRLGGDWYHVDCTYGDPETREQLSMISYDYLLLSDDDISVDHTESAEFNYPRCNDRMGNFYVLEGLCLDTYDYDRIRNFMRICKENGLDLMFKCSSDQVFDEVQRNLIDGERIFSLLKESGIRTRNISYYTDRDYRTYKIQLDY